MKYLKRLLDYSTGYIRKQDVIWLIWINNVIDYVSKYTFISTVFLFVNVNISTTENLVFVCILSGCFRNQ